jgi:hypothetical protein
MLLGCTVSAHAGEETGDPGTYLSAQLGGGRIAGGNASGNPWMRSRAGELRIGRALKEASSSRIDVVYYNEGHPDNNHRDGYALQWSRVWRDGERLSGEVGIGPYLTRNRREDPGMPGPTRRNVLISLQAERALSDRTRVFFDFGRVKTFLRMDDRDLFLVGMRKRF